MTDKNERNKMDKNKMKKSTSRFKLDTPGSKVYIPTHRIGPPLL